MVTHRTPCAISVDAQTWLREPFTSGQDVGLEKGHTEDEDIRRNSNWIGMQCLLPVPLNARAIIGECSHSSGRDRVSGQSGRVLTDQIGFMVWQRVPARLLRFCPIEQHMRPLTLPQSFRSFRRCSWRVEAITKSVRRIDL